MFLLFLFLLYLAVAIHHPLINKASQHSVIFLRKFIQFYTIFYRFFHTHTNNNNTLRMIEHSSTKA